MRIHTRTIIMEEPFELSLTWLHCPIPSSTGHVADVRVLVDLHPPPYCLSCASLLSGLMSYRFIMTQKANRWRYIGGHLDI